MIIREYKLEDKEAIERCIFELQEDEYARQPEYWQKPLKVLEDNYFGYLLKWMKDSNGTLFVAEIEGEVAGCVAIAIDEGKDSNPSSPCIAMKRMGYVPDIIVLRKYQKQGVGKELLNKAEEYTKSKDCEFISLDVTTGNPALDFYHNNGYKNYSINLKKKLSE